MFTTANVQTRRYRRMRLVVATVGLVSAAGIIASLAVSALPLNPAPAPEFEFDSALDITMDGEGQARVEYVLPNGADCDGLGGDTKTSTLDLSGQEDLTATGAKLQETKNLTLLACDEDPGEDCSPTLNSSAESTTGYIVDAGDTSITRIRVYIVTKTASGGSPEYLNPKVQLGGEGAGAQAIAEAEWKIPSGAGEEMIATVPFTANADTNKVKITTFSLDRSETGTFVAAGRVANLKWELFDDTQTSIGSGTIEDVHNTTETGTLTTTNVTAGDDYVLEVTLDTINEATASTAACGTTDDNQATFVVIGEVILTAQN